MVTAVPATAIRASIGRRGEPAGLTDALNCDIDDVGYVSRRSAWMLATASDAHSLFEHDGTTYCVVDGVLGYLDGTAHVPIGEVPHRLAWTVLNGEPCFATHEGVYLVRERAILPLPTGFDNDAEDELMLAPLPGGHAVAYWNGRLVVARGNSLLWSEPLRYGVFNPLANFAQFEERITWLAPLEAGLYIGLRSSVRFLRGADPAAFAQLRVGGRSWARCGATIKTAGMDPEVSQGAAEVAAWLTERGFAVGLPSGQVIHPQADRLNNLPLGTGRMVVLGDRITVLSN